LARVPGEELAVEERGDGAARVAGNGRRRHASD
jgi:hypothetical protein